MPVVAVGTCADTDESSDGFGQGIDHHHQVCLAMHAGFFVDRLQACPGAGTCDAQRFGSKQHVSMHAQCQDQRAFRAGKCEQLSQV